MAVVLCPRRKAVSVEWTMISGLNLAVIYYDEILRITLSRCFDNDEDDCDDYDNACVWGR